MTPDQIRSIRKAIGFSQEKLAQLLGVTWTTVHRWEAGATGPTGNSLRLLTLLEAAVRDPAFQAVLKNPRASDPMYMMYVLLEQYFKERQGGAAIGKGSPE